MIAKIQRKLRPAARPARHPDERNLVRSKGRLRFKSLLVPTDFSEASIKGLDRALSLAKQFGSQIRLIHVVESRRVFNDTKTPFAEWDKGVIEQAKLRLDKLEQEKIDEWIPVLREVRIGRPHQEICKAAQTHKADLIVISTHGRTGLKHLFLGSTAEHVVRNAPCSVLVVRTQDTDARLTLEKILVPVDFSKNSLEAVHYAIALAREFQSKIHLLYVVPAYYPTADEMMREIRILETELEESGEKRLAQLVKEMSPQNVEISTQIRRGRPATEITESARESNADLIVISTHGLTGWDRVLLGSTTEEVVRYASCPVLVARDRKVS